MNNLIQKEFIAVIVLYKETFTSATTIKSIKENCLHIIDKVHFIIWDNSPTEMPLQEFEYIQNLDYEYIHTPQNIALSKIYNKVIERYKEKRLLFLFDQDSTITEEYFEKCIAASAKNANIGLFVPYIMHNDLIVSPGSFFIYKGKYWKELKTGIIKSHNTLAITSGMCIRLSCLNGKLKFDENLVLYGIDSMFCINYWEEYPNLYVIDYRLNHNLSLFNSENYEIKKRRFISGIKSQCYIAKQISFTSYILAVITSTVKYIWGILRHHF